MEQEQEDGQKKSFMNRDIDTNRGVDFFKNHPFLALVVFIISIYCLISLISFRVSNNDSTAQPTQNQVTSSEKPYSYFGDGTYLVGLDILPGTYRTEGVSNCYWERLKGFSGGNDDLIANDLSSGVVIVSISPTDAGFKSTRCGTWNKISASPTNNVQNAQSGSKITNPISANPAQATPKTQSIDFSQFQAVDFDLYHSNPKQYDGSSIYILGMFDGTFLPSNSVSDANYIEIENLGNISQPKIEIKISNQRDYTAVVSSLTGSILKLVRVYGTGSQAEQFSLSNGTSVYWPVLNAERVDECADSIPSYVSGQSSCSQWQTVFPQNVSQAVQLPTSSLPWKQTTDQFGNPINNSSNQTAPPGYYYNTYNQLTPY